MNTKLLMTSSAVILGVSGVLLQFLPTEVLNYFHASPDGINRLFVQLAGALYLGFAMMNWMAKTVLIGGIYARPLAIGNFAHFLIGALALLRYAFAAAAPDSLSLWLLTIIYGLFAVLFGIVFLNHPLKANNTVG